MWQLRPSGSSSTMCGLFQCSGAFLFSPGCLLRCQEKVRQGMSFPTLSPLFIFGWHEGSGDLESSVVCPESWQCHLTSNIIPWGLFYFLATVLISVYFLRTQVFLSWRWVVSWQCESQEPGRPWAVTLLWEPHGMENRGNDLGKRQDREDLCQMSHARRQHLRSCARADKTWV